MRFCWICAPCDRESKPWPQAWRLKMALSATRSLTRFSPAPPLDREPGGNGDPHRERLASGAERTSAHPAIGCGRSAGVPRRDRLVFFRDRGSSASHAPRLSALVPTRRTATRGRRSRAAWSGDATRWTRPLTEYRPCPWRAPPDGAHGVRCPFAGLIPRAGWSGVSAEAPGPRAVGPPLIPPGRFHRVDRVLSSRARLSWFSRRSTANDRRSSRGRRIRLPGFAPVRGPASARRYLARAARRSCLGCSSSCRVAGAVLAHRRGLSVAVCDDRQPLCPPSRAASARGFSAPLVVGRRAGPSRRYRLASTFPGADAPEYRRPFSVLWRLTPRRSGGDEPPDRLPV